MNIYKDLKTEFRRQTFRDKIFSIHGHKCYNCGSDLYVELHHIVPLFLGGSNKDTNIVPLCYECHKKRMVRERCEDIYVLITLVVQKEVSPKIMKKSYGLT